MRSSRTHIVTDDILQFDQRIACFFFCVTCCVIISLDFPEITIIQTQSVECYELNVDWTSLFFYIAKIKFYCKKVNLEESIRYKLTDTTGIAPYRIAFRIFFAVCAMFCIHYLLKLFFKNVCTELCTERLPSS